LNKFDAYEFPHINYYHFVVDVTFILFLWFVCCLCYHVIGEYKFHFSKLHVWQWIVIYEDVADVALNILNRSSRFLFLRLKWEGWINDPFFKVEIFYPKDWTYERRLNVDTSTPVCYGVCYICGWLWARIGSISYNSICFYFRYPEICLSAVNDVLPVSGLGVFRIYKCHSILR
jgi:hypothetical protein